VNVVSLRRCKHESIEEISFMKNLLIALCMLVSVTTQAQRNSAQSLNLSESLTLQHPGEFTKKKPNEYFTSLIGGCDSGKTYQTQQLNYPTDAVDGCVTIPSTSTTLNAFGVVGMVNDNSGVTGGAGGYFQAFATVTNGFIEGVNALATFNCPLPCTGMKVEGAEIDVGPGNANVSVNGSSRLIGLQITGGTNGGAVPTNAAAISISPMSWSWPHGLAFARGATSTYGIFLDGQTFSGATQSQTLAFQSWNAGGVNHIQEFYNDSSGQLQLKSAGVPNPEFVVNEPVRIHGNLQVDGTVSKGAGSFQIDHPLDPANKYLYHSFVESPDMMNVYNGNVITNNRGVATVVLPDYFEALNRDFRYQLTVIGQFAQAIVGKKIGHNRFVIRTSKPNVEVSWQVTGIRQDTYANAHRIQVEEEKPPQEQGHYLHPELFGGTEKQAIGATSSPAMSLPVTAAVTNAADLR
jgi:hypothetical protein